jgi:hypothetical protein
MSSKKSNLSNKKSKNITYTNLKNVKKSVSIPDLTNARSVKLIKEADEPATYLYS